MGHIRTILLVEAVESEVSGPLGPLDSVPGSGAVPLTRVQSLVCDPVDLSGARGLRLCDPVGGGLDGRRKLSKRKEGKKISRIFPKIVSF